MDILATLSIFATLFDMRWLCGELLRAVVLDTLTYRGQI
jgi:hypothetical protein